MFVFMTASLADILFNRISNQCHISPIVRWSILTDLTIGLFGMDTVAKLNGPAEPLSLDSFCADASVELELNDGFPGLKRLGSVEPRGLLGGNVSTNGDRESGSIRDGAGEDSSGGGVGERGGRGMGRFEAIVL